LCSASAAPNAIAGDRDGAFRLRLCQSVRF
jgi:hypothetical protein